MSNAMKRQWTGTSRWLLAVFAIVVFVSTALHLAADSQRNQQLSAAMQANEQLTAQYTACQSSVGALHWRLAENSRSQ